MALSIKAVQLDNSRLAQRILANVNVQRRNAPDSDLALAAVVANRELFKLAESRGLNPDGVLDANQTLKVSA